MTRGPGLVAAATIILPLFLASRATTSGLTYRMSAYGNVGPDLQTHSPIGIWEVRLAGEHERIDVEGFHHDTYYLFTRGKPVAILVDSSERQYTEVDYSAIGKKLEPMEKTVYTNVSITAQRAAPDSTIDGYPTQHWRVTDDHMEATTVMILHGTEKSHMTLDYYVAAAFQNDMNPFMRGTDMIGSAIGSTPSGAAYLEKLRAAERQVSGGGLPLLIVMQQRSVDDKGNRGEETTIRRIGGIRKVDVAPSVFAIPAGYRKTAPPSDSLDQAVSNLADTLNRRTATKKDSAMGAFIRDLDQALHGDTGRAAKPKVKPKVP
jgi:hypothetical protein